MPNTKYSKLKYPSNTHLYELWIGLKTRCRNQKSVVYKDFGAIGYTICDEWYDSYILFHDWAINNGYAKALMLHTDNTKIFSANHCYWGKKKNRNLYGKNNGGRRTPNLYTAFGETKTIKQWLNDNRCMVNYTTLQQRLLKSKWPVEIALTHQKKSGISHKI